MGTSNSTKCWFCWATAPCNSVYRIEQNETFCCNWMTSTNKSNPKIILSPKKQLREKGKILSPLFYFLSSSSKSRTSLVASQSLTSLLTLIPLFIKPKDIYYLPIYKILFPNFFLPTFLILLYRVHKGLF